MQPDIPQLTAIHGRAVLVGRETGGADGAVGWRGRGEEDPGKGERGQTLVGI